MSTDFHRIRRLPPYVFEEVNKDQARLRAEGDRHHRLRHGQSGHAHAASIGHRRQADRDGARPPRRAAIPRPKGDPLACVRQAMANYHGRRFGVKLNPDTEVIATLGSKEGPSPAWPRP
ncbi:hypothetical protein ACRAWD_27880 [Caulobacter segnis]